MGARPRAAGPADGDPSRVRVAQIVDDTEAEGPGRRLALWVQGCDLGCPGCCNPEMFDFAGGEAMTVEALVARVEDARRAGDIEGISLLGGEPFAQAAPLARLAAAARTSGLTVMVYSGYTLAELRAAAASRPGVTALLAACDLLVDGRYVREEPETRRRWIGSRNQLLHVFGDRQDAADPRLGDANTVEIRLAGGELRVNGWPAAARAIGALGRWRRTRPGG